MNEQETLFEDCRTEFEFIEEACRPELDKLIVQTGHELVARYRIWQEERVWNESEEDFIWPNDGKSFAEFLQGGNNWNDIHEEFHDSCFWLLVDQAERKVFRREAGGMYSLLPNGLDGHTFVNTCQVEEDIDDDYWCDVKTQAEQLLKEVQP